jgi:signal transduction histidine kinase
LITVVAGVILVLVFAIVFSVAYGTRRITAHAAALHTVDETLLSATVARAQLAIAAHAASVDREFGTNSSEAIGLSVEEASLALADLAMGTANLEDAAVSIDGALFETAAAFTATAEQILGHLAADDSQSAQMLATGGFDTEFRAAVAELVEARDYLSTEVARSDVNLGKVGNAARFLAAFIVPTAVILLYRELVKRQQRHGDLERRLETEQKLGKARDEFVANASHELRTPLTSIYGLALLLEEDEAFQVSETAPELVNMIISEAADLSRMVEDLLTTARLDAGALHYTFENVDVRDEIDEVAAPMRRAGVDIEVECEPGIVRADRLRFRQVLRNLLSNARKYGGPMIRVTGKMSGGKLVTTVADDGDGIPKDLEERLFERYIHRGTQPMVLGSVGLGLSIVSALAEGMGGSVGYSYEDGWAQFHFAVPLVAVASEERDSDQDVDRLVEQSIFSSVTEPTDVVDYGVGASEAADVARGSTGGNPSTST